MRRPSNLTALLLLGVAVAGSQFLLWWLKPAPAPRAEIGPPRSAYTLKDFKLTVMGVDGRIDVQLEAPQLTRRDGDGSLFIDAPRFQLPAARGAPWNGQSEYAWLAADGNEMRLQGDVTMQRPASIDVGAADIATADLTIWPDTQRAATKAPTLVREPGRILHGTGLAADLAHHTLELLADVHGTFQPAPHH